MSQEERLLLILENLTANNRITVDEICTKFDVSRDTARRDLVKLAEQQKIIRTRGGAILPTQHKKVHNYEVFSKNYLYTPQTARELITIEMDRLCTANPDIDRAELEHYANTQFKQTNFSFINSYKDLEDESIPVYNILAFSFDQQKLAKGWETFKEDTSVTLVTSGKYNFEFEHLLASKGHALTKLADHLGISLQETLAMGDSMNDLSMLTLVGYPVAMGNAREDVKAVCLEVADTNDQNGVAKTINKMLNQIKVAN